MCIQFEARHGRVTKKRKVAKLPKPDVVKHLVQENSSKRDVPVVFQEPISLVRSDSVESSRSSSSTTSSNSVNNNKRPAQDLLAFGRVLLHAVKCRSCDSTACQKMRLVLAHFKSCKVPRSEVARCQVCSQLLAIIAQNEALRMAIKIKL